MKPFFDFVRRNPTLAAAQRVGVAVSGGGDSVALACLARESFSSLTLLHMNYGLRGVESDLDENFVQNLALRLGCDFLVERAVPLGRSEDELRRLRYEWFSKCEVDAVLTGHTREDQAETLLFRLVRGTGPGGLAGISPVLDGRIYRPLLEVGRGEIRSWLESQGIGWREDSSNLDLGYRRNWIRHELLPVLRRELNPEVDRALGNLAEIVWNEAEWIDDLVRARLNGMVWSEGDALVLDCSKFCAEPVGLKRRLMRQLMERAKGDLRELEFTHIDGALHLCDEKEGNGRIQVPGLDLMRSFGLLRVITLEALRAMPERNFRVALPVPGKVLVPEDAGIVVTTLDPGCNYNESGRSLDWDRLLAAMDAERRLELRNWRPGDFLIRGTSTEPEKVKELFQKHRIPLWRRRAWPIVVLGNLPVWAGEFGPTADFASRPETRTALRIEWMQGWVS